jgi:hypothetical protein
MWIPPALSSSSTKWHVLQVSFPRVRRQRKTLPCTDSNMVGTLLHSQVARHVENGHQHTHDAIIKMHGIMLTVLFSVFIPAGIIMIRSGVRQSFKFHWIVQVIVTLVAISAMAVMIARSWSSIMVSHLVLLVH